MNPCCTPSVPVDNEGDGRWNSIHTRFLLDARDKDPEVVFVGDSILQALEQSDVWKQLFAPLHCLNFSIHRDQTQHVLWRISNGEIDHVDPKVIVLHVGTNNISNSAEEISEGILKIVQTIKGKHPNVYIVIPSLLPRGQHPNPLREKNSKVNTIVKEKITNIPKVELVEIDKGFVQPDGTISHHDMQDYLLPTNNACQKAFEPIYELLLQILSEAYIRNIMELTKKVNSYKTTRVVLHNRTISIAFR